MKKQFAIIGIIILLLTMVLSGCMDSNEEDDLSGLSYKNTQYGFGINPPMGWTVYGSNPNAIVTFAGPLVEDSFIIIIAISLHALENDQTIYSELDKAILNLSEVYSDFMLISRTNRTINGMNAQEIIYTITTPEGLKVKQKQVVIEKKSKALTFAYSATPNSFDIYNPIIEESLKSIKIIW